MRLVFAGTPESATIPLTALLGSHHDVVAVLTRPPARTGRGRAVHPSPVALLAEKHGIEVLTPPSLRPQHPDSAALRTRLAELAPDCIPVVAYGAMIPSSLLTYPAHGWINLHFSLLPQYRGAAPVQAALRDGASSTGVSIFRIDEGLDTGPLLAQKSHTIAPTDTADSLLTDLSDDGADLLLQVLDALENGEISGSEQVGVPTYAPKITSDDARISWNQPARSIDAHIRAMTSHPGAWTTMQTPQGELRIKVAPVEIGGSPDCDVQPGRLYVTKKNVWVGTADVPVKLTDIQPSGKKMMDAAAWTRGMVLEEETIWQ